jgi:hypothetical protein
MFYGPTDKCFGMFGLQAKLFTLHIFPRTSVWGYKKYDDTDCTCNEFNFGPFFAIDWFSSYK